MGLRYSWPSGQPMADVHVETCPCTSGDAPFHGVSDHPRAKTLVRSWLSASVTRFSPRVHHLGHDPDDEPMAATNPVQCGR